MNVSANPSSIHSAALAVAAKLSANVEFVTEITGLANKKQDTQVGPVKLMLMFNGIFDVDTMAGWPVVGSEQHVYEGTRVVKINNTFDKYTTTQTGDDGKTRKIEGSFYHDMADGLPPAVEAIERSKALKDAIDNKEGADPILLAKGKSELQSLKKTAEGRRNYIRRCVREAAELTLAVIAANEIDGVEVTLLQEDDGSITSTLPIMVNDVSNHTKARLNSKPLSVPSFLAYDASKVTPEAVTKHGGAWQAFVNSGTRKGSSGQGNTGANTEKRIKTMDEFFGVMAMVYHYLDDMSEDGKKHRAELMVRLADPKAGDDNVETLGKVCIATDEVWTHVERRFNDLMARKAATAKQQAA